MIFWSFERASMGEREREGFFLLNDSPKPSIYRVLRVGEDPVRMGRISDCYNPQSWSFGLPVLLLLRSLHPDTRFE